MGKITVGTRKNKLAKIQTNAVIEMLKRSGVHYNFEIKEFITKQDKHFNDPLSKIDSDKAFMQEIDDALLNNHIDIAVHSLKDTPSTLEEGLMIIATPLRKNHRNAYIATNHIKFNDLPGGSVIGTSSLLCSAQILALRPDLNIKWINGTVGSRIQKLHGEQYDAIILAAEDIIRLGIKEEVITEYLSHESFVPVAGQGALAVECREHYPFVKEMLVKINDPNTEASIRAERLVVQQLDPEGKAPIGCYADVINEELHIQATVLSKDGKTVLYETASGKKLENVVKKITEKLIEKGAKKIIKQSYE